MSKSVTFVKSSMPYNPGDVVTFEDDKADEVLRHPMGIARPATEADIAAVYTGVGRKPPPAAAEKSSRR